MSSSGASSRARSNSTSRSSRRTTMTFRSGGQSPAGHLGSPGDGAMRTRVLRERSGSNDEGSLQNIDPISSVGRKANVATMTGVNGTTRAKHMQFAFGSKVMKPLSTKTGISSAAGDVRGRVQGGAVADAANTRARQRRERTAKTELLENPRVAPRGRAVTPVQNHPPQSPAFSTREETDVTALKSQLQEREAIIVNLKMKLEKESTQGKNASGDNNLQLSRSAPTQVDGGKQKQQQYELDAGAQAALKLVEEEAREEVEEALVGAEAAAAACLSSTEGMQTRVNEMIRLLKARRK